MKKHMMMRLALLVGLLIPLSLQASVFGWMGKKESDDTPQAIATNAVKRLHLTLSNKEAEKEWIQLTSVKKIIAQERRVLKLLIEEKKNDLSNLDAEFSKSFGIKRDRNYRFDAKTRTIYEEGDKPGTSTNAPGAAARWVKKLETEPEARKFASLAAAKQITQEDLQVLVRLAREKELSVTRIEGTLKEKYSMSRDRDYWYDTKTMRLYEIVNPSRTGVVQ